MYEKEPLEETQMKKKNLLSAVLTVVLALAMCLSLAACGSTINRNTVPFDPRPASVASGQ